MHLDGINSQVRGGTREDLLKNDDHWPCIYGEEIIGAVSRSGGISPDGCKWMCGARLLNMVKPS